MVSWLVEIDSLARQEYSKAFVWYHAQNPTAAINFEETIAQAITKIAQSPSRWPFYMFGCRRYVLDQFPFSIVYEVEDSRIVIVAFAHARRRPGYWKNRL